jgi:hypothetical protein
MKNTLLISLTLSLLFISSFSVFGQEEISLFDSKGKPVAYIDTEDDLTIYMWSGKPVAYLYKKSDVYNIYGFNGDHLGWYEDGIIYNHDGYVVGFSKGAVNKYTEHEPYKSYKSYKPYKSYKEYAPYKPYLSNSFSNMPLSIFLLGGID